MHDTAQGDDGPAQGHDTAQGDDGTRAENGTVQGGNDSLPGCAKDAKSSIAQQIAAQVGAGW